MKVFFLVFVILVIIQWYFKTKQIHEIHKYYNLFITDGHVIIERHKGLLSGAIVILKLDNQANILDCVYVSGATFLARWKKCDRLMNKNLRRIQKKDLIQYKNSLRKVIWKAKKHYKVGSDP